MNKKFRELALELGLKKSGRIYYGELYGMMTTFSSTIAAECIHISNKSSPDEQLRLTGKLNFLKEKYKADVNVTPYGINFLFIKNVGENNMEYIREFAMEFLPKLKDHGVNSADICPLCGKTHYGRSIEKLYMGNAVRIHPECYEIAMKEARDKEEKNKNAPSSSTLGTIAALIGGIIGAVIIAIVQALTGNFYNKTGIIMGVLIAESYIKFGKTEKKYTFFVLIGINVICIIFAAFLGVALEFGKNILMGQLHGTFGDIPLYIKEMLSDDPEFRMSFIKDTFLCFILGIPGIAISIFAFAPENILFGKNFKDLK